MMSCTLHSHANNAGNVLKATVRTTLNIIHQPQNERLYHSDRNSNYNNHYLLLSFKKIIKAKICHWPYKSHHLFLILHKLNKYLMLIKMWLYTCILLQIDL